MYDDERVYWGKLMVSVCVSAHALGSGYRRAITQILRAHAREKGQMRDFTYVMSYPRRWGRRACADTVLTSMAPDTSTARTIASVSFAR